MSQLCWYHINFQQLSNRSIKRYLHLSEIRSFKSFAQRLFQINLDLAIEEVCEIESMKRRVCVIASYIEFGYLCEIGTWKVVLQVDGRYGEVLWDGAVIFVFEVVFDVDVQDIVVCDVIAKVLSQQVDDLLT